MARPIVSIIGRPNVGKSTLFNKLVGQRISITEDTPGVTRDRLYREVEWQNHFFMLMDTGGLEFDSEDEITKQIELQVEVAFDSADLILFLVDGRQGITALDRQVAERIRRSGKPVLLVVNKVDTHTIPPEIYEFYELGFDELSIISAEQGYGLGDLLDTIFDHLPPDANVAWEEEALKICLIGKPNVGKSSLVNHLLGEERMIVSNIPGTTRDSIDSYYERDGQKYMIIDTAGLRRQRSIDSRIEKYSVLRTYAAIDRSDLCLLLIDATEGVSEQDTKIAGYAHEQGKAAIIVINKWDLIEKDTNTQRDYGREVRKVLSFMDYAPMVFYSVKTGYHERDLFQEINHVDENYSRRISTGMINQILREATQLNPPPTDKGRRLKILYASQVTARPPKIIFYANDKDLFHFSYLRYLENRIRNSFDFTGVPLTLEVRERQG